MFAEEGRARRGWHPRFQDACSRGRTPVFRGSWDDETVPLSSLAEASNDGRTALERWEEMKGDQ